MNRQLLSGKTAVITGCNRGIGYELLKVFLENGADIIACLRRPDSAFKKTKKDLESASEGHVIDEVYFDLEDPTEVREAVNGLVGKKYNIDIIVNNAGALKSAAVHLTSQAVVQEMLTINFSSQLYLTQSLSRPMMRKKAGCIINIASTAALDGNAGRMAYAASKSALIAATKVISREMGRYNVRANVIAPGLTETDMMRDSTADQMIEEVLGGVSLGRTGFPREIANVALFLASDLASYITGQVIRVDGGM
jgi:3-oxoacyl-[acyl-carrier protein] reductase